MAWNLEGTFYENCSCTAICPCTWSNMTAPATNDFCKAALAFNIASGEIDGTDVSGCSMVMMVDSPPLMSEGNWNVGLIIDSGASDAQAEALGSVMSGALGGPPAALGPLLGNFIGVERHPISITTDNGTHTVTVGDSVSYTGRPELNEAGEVVQLSGILTHPAGPTLGLAPVESSTVSAMGIEFGGENLSGFSNPFSWTG